ncbi:hypothetical protein [Aquamicrobium sp. LC103]|uniref:hypothetical protein n=1 Tax=Aquamicrobium sp. LC103 TaxID=1120658 RepID=UPI00063EA73D|nr:hypothetical protein [Aquamicrobium sp. LC103]TKT82885.1 hypothetical protein XW59_002670 [Aquamicrobium sp. LC103]
MGMKRFLALFALVVFAAFCSVVVIFVPHVALAITIFIGLALAGYDIWDQLFRRRGRPAGRS